MSIDVARTSATSWLPRGTNAVVTGQPGHWARAGVDDVCHAGVERRGHRCWGCWSANVAKKAMGHAPASRVVGAPPPHLFSSLNDNVVIVRCLLSVIVVVRCCRRTPPRPSALPWSKRRGQLAISGDDGVILVVVLAVVVVGRWVVVVVIVVEWRCEANLAEKGKLGQHQGQPYSPRQCTCPNPHTAVNGCGLGAVSDFGHHTRTRTTRLGNAVG